MLLHCLKTYLLLWAVIVCSGEMVGRFESVKSIDGVEETLAVFKFRLLGRERFLNGTIIILTDFDEAYEGAVDIYSLKNDEWIQANIKVRTTACDLLINYIRKYYLSADTETNVPIAGKNCVKQGEYYLKNVQLATDNWPPFLTRGLIMVRIYFMLSGKIIGGMEITYTIKDKST